MDILHGSWLPAGKAHQSRFALWGETVRDGRSPGRKRAPRRTAAARPHPFAAPIADLRAAAAALSITAAEADRAVALLPSLESAPLPSGEQAGTDEATPASEIVLAPWEVETLCVGAADTTRLLLALGSQPETRQTAIGDDLRYWTIAARLALAILRGQHLMPALEPAANGWRARWRPLFDQSPVCEQVDALAAAMPPACRALFWRSDGDGAGVLKGALLKDFLGACVDALAREATDGTGGSARLNAAATRRQGAAAAWLAALRRDSTVAAEPVQLARLHEQYEAWVAAGQQEPADSVRLCLRLTPPEATGEPAAGANWSLDYLLQAADDPSLLVPADEVWRHRAATAQLLNRRVDNPQERLLGGLGRAARLFAPIEHSLHTATPETCGLTAAEAQAFIREGAGLLQAAGFGVLVPALQKKLGLRLRLSPRSRSGPNSTTSVLNRDRIVDYDWQLSLGDEPLSRQEFEALAALKEPLVQIRGQWVELRPELVQQALALFQQQDQGKGLTPEEALRLALSADAGDTLPVVEVETSGWIDELLHGNAANGQARSLDEPPGFAGRLRPYQKAGVAWLDTLARYGIGACLADDMGLGKTVQLIALLLHQRAAGSGLTAPVLLICPTSVAGNWQHELTRFAPDLRVLVHHGGGRTRSGFAEQATVYDVVISTYALLHRDEAELTQVEWNMVVLDEAQNIKNAATHAAQAAGRLRAGWRVALTGTPVENHLSDLWSLFRFLDPGYLGSYEDFRRRFAGPIERGGDTTAAARLKALISPLILRRLKTDRTIIEDLPEKNEMKVFCTLTPEQATLYQAVLRDSMRQVEAAEGIERRGLILAMIAKLKQTCDHPALLLKDGSALHGRSGKLARLTEMLEEVAEAGERALVFTQYAEMGRLLQDHLQQALDAEVLFLHGGTPAKARDRMVARFQEQRHGPPVFVLSIKAGGTGLNLTRANHVFHFDRWWNPAVENQATDRAFRIGQRRDVEVHKFICAGTFEEQIDELIERKLALTESIVGGGESWITEMSTSELRELFALREQAVTAG